jgi:hypothetical protein
MSLARPPASDKLEEGADVTVEAQRRNLRRRVHHAACPGAGRRIVGRLPRKHTRERLIGVEQRNVVSVGQSTGRRCVIIVQRPRGARSRASRERHDDGRADSRDEGQYRTERWQHVGEQPLRLWNLSRKHAGDGIRAAIAIEWPSVEADISKCAARGVPAEGAPGGAHRIACAIEEQDPHRRGQLDLVGEDSH